MASRGFSKTLRAAGQLAAPRIQQRSFIAARQLVRAAAARPVVGAAVQQVRGVKTMDFAGHKEDVYGKTASLICFSLLSFLFWVAADLFILSCRACRAL